MITPLGVTRLSTSSKSLPGPPGNPADSVRTARPIRPDQSHLGCPHRVYPELGSLRPLRCSEWPKFCAHFLLDDSAGELRQQGAPKLRKPSVTERTEDHSGPRVQRPAWRPATAMSTSSWVCRYRRTRAV